MKHGMQSGFKSSELNSPRKVVGGRVTTNRGYNGGNALNELIGAKKLSDPGVGSAKSKGKMKSY